MAGDDPGGPHSRGPAPKCSPTGLWAPHAAGLRSDTSPPLGPTCRHQPFRTRAGTEACGDAHPCRCGTPELQEPQDYKGWGAPRAAPGKAWPLPPPSLAAVNPGPPPPQFCDGPSPSSCWVGRAPGPGFRGCSSPRRKDRDSIWGRHLAPEGQRLTECSFCWNNFLLKLKFTSGKQVAPPAFVGWASSCGERQPSRTTRAQGSVTQGAAPRGAGAWEWPAADATPWWKGPRVPVGTEPPLETGVPPSQARVPMWGPTWRPGEQSDPPCPPTERETHREPKYRSVTWTLISP